MRPGSHRPCVLSPLLPVLPTVMTWDWCHLSPFYVEAISLTSHRAERVCPSYNSPGSVLCVTVYLESLFPLPAHRHCGTVVTYVDHGSGTWDLLLEVNFLGPEDPLYRLWSRLWPLLVLIGPYKTPRSLILSLGFYCPGTVLSPVGLPRGSLTRTLCVSLFYILLPLCTVKDLRSFVGTQVYLCFLLTYLFVLPFKSRLKVILRSSFLLPLSF